MPILQRRQTIRKHGYCSNCLAKSHLVGRCTSKAVCNTCGDVHHSLLHPRADKAVTRKRAEKRVNGSNMASRLGRRSEPTQSKSASKSGKNMRQRQVDNAERQTRRRIRFALSPTLSRSRSRSLVRSSASPTPDRSRSRPLIRFSASPTPDRSRSRTAERNSNSGPNPREVLGEVFKVLQRLQHLI